jgi:hypothetical protein
MSDITLPDEYILKILLHKFLTDCNYRQLIASTYEERIYEEFPSHNVISKLLINYYKKFDDIPSNDILKALIKKYAKQKEINSKSIVLEYDSILNLVDVNEKQCQESVITFLSKRIAYLAIIDHIDDIKNKQDVSSVLQKLEVVQNLSLDFDIGFSYFEQFKEHIKELENPDARLPTGWPDLDKCLNGGLYADGKCLMVFLAPTHVGKSLMMSNMAVNMLMQGKFVVLLSLEMSEFAVSTRISAHISDININRLHLNTGELLSKVTDFKSLHPNAELVIKEFPPNSINSKNIENHVDQICKKFNRKPDILMIDYLNLENPNHGLSRKAYEKLGDVSKENRALSYKFKAPVLSALQTNRCLDLNTEVITDSGHKLISELKTGDKILSKNNIYNDVIEIFPVSNQDVYEIELKSGKKIICSARHIFPTDKGEQSINSDLAINNKLYIH